MAACPKCNSELPEGLGLRFCTQCGASLTIVERPPRKAIDGPSDPGQPTEKPAPIRPALEPPTPRNSNDYASSVAARSRTSSVSADTVRVAPEPPAEDGRLEPELPRRVSGSGSGVVCRFCKSPLHLVCRLLLEKKK